jgi:signal transduction histidine kinase/ActR/RegA family two-component response regulator
MIGEYSVTALAFQDTIGAKECLIKLQTISSISNGIIYNEKGAVFARYDRNHEYFVSPLPVTSGSSTFDKNYLYVFQPIEYKGITYGTIYLRVSTALLSERINNSLITLIILLAGLVGLSFILAFQLQNIISKPILKLTSVIKKISNEADLSLRVTKMGSDEIGVLYDGFNTMLEQLHTREIEQNRAEKEKGNLHAQLLQSQKMEALGKLAGGIAHDFNNLLTIIYGYNQFLLDRLENNTPLWEHAEKIRKAVEQSASLTHQLLALSRKQELEPKVIDLNAVLIDIEKMLEHVLGENIELVTILEPSIRQVKVDPGQLKQVILNLMVNAHDAMPEGGEITLITENIMRKENYSLINHEARAGSFVRLSIVDTGIGIDKAILGQIFDPFFTTKEIGLGTGLGLSVVYGIVKQNNGWIEVNSEPGQGTTFMIYLPTVTEKIDDEIKDTIDLKDLRGNGERILLVEDEAEIRRFAAIALRENGYCVFEAANAKEAQNIFKNENENFKLIFSDVVLPDKNGVQLVDDLILQKPNLQVVLSSGYIGQKSQWAEIKNKGFIFLQKPYHISELLKAIKEVGIKDDSHS